MFNSLRPHGLQPARFLCQGKNTRVGCHALLQGIFPTLGLNPGLLHCRWILSRLSHQGSSRILEWVAYPFLQGIFRTQELNRGLLHSRWILYQLTYHSQGEYIKGLGAQEGHHFASLLLALTLSQSDD